MLLWPCAQYKLRYMSLNHVEPGSGWSNYQCCQGMFGGCCCIQPGNMGESSCPQCCMCLEGCLLPGMAVSASQGVIMQRYGLGLDSDDVKLIRCNNCLQLLACVASCLNICIDFDGDDGELMVLCFLVICSTPNTSHQLLLLPAIVGLINLVADITFCCVSGCMTARVYHEIKEREKEAPQGQKMQR